MLCQTNTNMLNVKENSQQSVPLQSHSLSGSSSGSICRNFFFFFASSRAKLSEKKISETIAVYGYNWIFCCILHCSAFLSHFVRYSNVTFCIFARSFSGWHVKVEQIRWILSHLAKLLRTFLRGVFFVLHSIIPFSLNQHSTDRWSTTILFYFTVSEKYLSKEIQLKVAQVLQPWPLKYISERDENQFICGRNFTTPKSISI